jgi:heat shock protein HtpX
MAAYGLYSHIRANRLRSIFLIVGLFFLVYLLAFAGSLIAAVFTEGDAPLDYLLYVARQNLLPAIPIATGLTLIWLWIAWLFHQRMIDSMVGGHDVTRQEEPKLYNLLENLCVSRGIPMPKLKIVEDGALNAFATGLNQKQYAISVTRGLLERLDPPELEAVLAHELTHIRNGDVRLLVVAVVIAGVISFFGELVFRGMFRGGFRVGRSSGDRKGGAAIAILIALTVILIAWLLSIVIRFSLSRTREFLADAGAVELTKNPDAMIMALRKIEGRGELQRATASVMEMCVDNPHSGFVDLFSTHPSIDRRVEALV